MCVACYVFPISSWDETNERYVTRMVVTVARFTILYNKASIILRMFHKSTYRTEDSVALRVKTHGEKITARVRRERL